MSTFTVHAVTEMFWDGVLRAGGLFVMFVHSLAMASEDTKDSKLLLLDLWDE